MNGTLFSYSPLTWGSNGLIPPTALASSSLGDPMDCSWVVLLAAKKATRIEAAAQGEGSGNGRLQNAVPDRQHKGTSLCCAPSPLFSSSFYIPTTHSCLSALSVVFALYNSAVEENETTSQVEGIYSTSRHSHSQQQGLLGWRFRHSGQPSRKVATYSSVI